MLVAFHKGLKGIEWLCYTDNTSDKPINLANFHIVWYTSHWEVLMKNKRAVPPVDIQGLGERILLARRRKNWSQAELATKAEIDRTIIPEIERGTKPGLNLLTFVCLALALDKSPNELLGWEEMRHKHNVSEERQTESLASQT